MKTFNSIYFQFFLLVLVYFLVNELANETLQIKNLFYASLSENLTDSQIENMKTMQQKWQLVGYLIIPVFLFLKLLVIGSVIYGGIFFFSNKEVKFSSLFRNLIYAEYLFLSIPLIKIGWFTLVENHYTYQDVMQFYPLSSLNILGTKGIESWLMYPFQLLNLFELAYVFILAYCIGKITQTNMDKGFKIVSYSYVPALLLWASVVMFFTLSNS